jgi:hypothetical protein
LRRAEISSSPVFSRRPAVQFAHGVDDLALFRRDHALRVGEVEDRLALGPEGDALVGAREHAAAPERGAAARTAGAALQHDEAGEVGALAAQSVGHPSAHARAAEEAAARVHEQLGGSVVEEVGLAGLDEAQLVGDRRGVRQHVADPGAAGAVLLELLVVTEEVHAVARAHEREPLAFDEAGRDGLAVEFVELRLVVEKLQLAGASRP